MIRQGHCREYALYGGPSQFDGNPVSKRRRNAIKCRDSGDDDDDIYSDCSVYTDSLGCSSD